MTIISQYGNLIIQMKNYDIVRFECSINAITLDGKREVSLATYSSKAKAEIEWKRLQNELIHGDHSFYRFRKDEEVMG